MKPLLVLCALSMLLGTGALLAASRQASAAEMLEEVVRFAASIAADGMWLWFLRLTLGLTAVALLSTLVEMLWKPGKVARSVDVVPLEGKSLSDALGEIKERLERCTRETSNPDIIRLFDELAMGALRVAASDIHMSPAEGRFRITYRVQGSLHEVGRIAPELGPMLVTRTKVLARMNTFVKNKPQDGRLVAMLEQGDLEARVSTLATEWGERVVLRLVRGGRSVPNLHSLGFPSPLEQRLARLLASPQGVLFVTGPVGSGKTTTLYAALKDIFDSRGTTASLVSLEDPVEMELGFVTQTQINAQVGLTFPKVLRSVLRQDPNVLMVGEIRDHETAEIAAQAGLTGHLLLTTVHASSAAGVFPRVMDMGVEPFALASSSLGSLSQRLVRTLCTACRREAAPSAEEQARFDAMGIALPDAPFYEPVGCPYCENTGFAGRIPIAELVQVSAEFEQAIQSRCSTRDLEELAISQGMVPLIQDGIDRAVAGDTSLGEVLRAAG